MFDLEQAIGDWRREMAARGPGAPEVLDELESHLRERTERLKSGLNEVEAFQTAVQELGQAGQLKQEFARARRPSIWNWRANPMALNVVAIWFMWLGLNALSQIVWLQFLLKSWGPENWAVSGFCLVFALQFPVGVGLLRRANGWRYAAIVFLALDALSAGGTLTHDLLSKEPAFLNAYYIYMGASIPMHFRWLTEGIGLVMALWAGYVLTRPAIRSLFQPAPREHAA